MNREVSAVPPEAVLVVHERTGLGVALAGRLLLPGLLAALLLLGWTLPRWLNFLLTLALAKGLVVLGLVLLMRAGLVSFGQGLFFAAAAYAAAFAIKLWGVREAFLLLPLGMAAAAGLAVLTGLLSARYRAIFFAMLTLAFSMVLYGLLIKAYPLTGGSDGLRVAVPTVLGYAPDPQRARVLVYYLAVGAVAAAVSLVRRQAGSCFGTLTQAIRDNEVRVEYLGVPVRRAVLAVYLEAAVLAGMGGVLAALAVGHVDPNLAYWTTSGEFVFIALLGGAEGVLAPLAGAVLYEAVKAYAFKYAPYAWQMVMGVLMLLIILFLPSGLWAPLERRWLRPRG